jgi:hypothetical protein
MMMMMMMMNDDTDDTTMDDGYNSVCNMIGYVWWIGG